MHVSVLKYFRHSPQRGSQALCKTHAPFSDLRIAAYRQRGIRWSLKNEVGHFFAKRSPWIRKVVRVFAPLWLLKNPRNNPNKPPHLSGWHLSVGLWLWMVDSINLVGLGRWSSGPPTHPSYQIMPVAPGTLERGVITPYSLEIEL